MASFAFASKESLHQYILRAGTYYYTVKEVIFSEEKSVVHLRTVMFLAENRVVVAWEVSFHFPFDLDGTSNLKGK